jgi:hypothetical protein
MNDNIINYFLLKIAQNKNNPKKVRAYRTLLNEAIKMKLQNDYQSNQKSI